MTRRMLSGVCTSKAGSKLPCKAASPSTLSGCGARVQRAGLRTNCRTNIVGEDAAVEAGSRDVFKTDAGLARHACGKSRGPVAGFRYAWAVSPAPQGTRFYRSLRRRRCRILGRLLEHRQYLIRTHVVAAFGYAKFADEAGDFGFELDHGLVAFNFGDDVAGIDMGAHRHVPFDQGDGGIVRRHAGQADIRAHVSRQAAAQASRIALVSMPWWR